MWTRFWWWWAPLLVLYGVGGSGGEDQQLPKLVVQRSNGYSGSNWLASLLRREGLATYFQFGGACHTQGGDKALVSLRKLLDAGCKCVDRMDEGWPMRCTAAAYSTCTKLPYCTTGKCAHAKSGCEGVAVVAPPFLDLKHLLQLLPGSAKLVAWIRDNSVKHAVSKLKASCKSDAFENHASKARNPAAVAALHIKPQRLLAWAVHFRESRDKYRASLLEHDNIHVAYYEDFQRNATYEVRRMLGPRERRLTSFETHTNKTLHKPTTLSKDSLSKDKTLHKLTSDSLKDVLLNYADSESFFVREEMPCLTRLLQSDHAERSLDDGCDDQRPTWFHDFYRDPPPPTIVDCHAKKARLATKNTFHPRHFITPAYDDYCKAAVKRARDTGRLEAAVKPGTERATVCIIS